ncbi:MAG: YdbL family protein [Deltaproteobacteria bacterium]|nr:YdbL family protein [Deltaproteobacteria bacterium]
MRTKFIVTMISLLLTLIFIAGVTAFAGSAEIKAGMQARLPAIDALKAEGIVGENNSGYLEFVGGNRKNADVVNAENSDRKAVYTAIAKQQGTTADLVGKRRALQIRGIAGPGEWLQDDSGKWYRK